VLLGIGLIAMGLVAAVLFALAWTGRWRRWTGQVILGPLPAPLTMFPALAALGLAFGLNLVGLVSARSPVMYVGFLILVAGLVLYVWAPPWWGPRWYRELERPIEPDMDDPLTAVVVAGTSPRRSKAPRAAPFGRSRPLKGWRGNWIAGEETGERPHKWARPGAVEGRLDMYPEGLAFAQSGVTRAFGEEPPELPVIPWERISAARVVPRGCGPDGHKRPSSGLRSIFPRLVIDTEDGPYLFEVQRAKRTARELQDALERRTAVANPA
jgi:uncharacterized membrane protein